MANIAHNIKERSVRNYITAGSFNGQFYNYTTSFNSNTLTTTGALSAVTGATVANCPQGRILRESGRKLFPGGAYPGISTMMVGVYDSISLLSGFIDPNSSVFAMYNTDKPVDVIDGLDLSGNVTKRGQPVFTLGDVIAGRQIRSTGGATLATTGTVNINANLGQVFTCAQTGALTLTATGTSPGPAGSIVYLIIAAATGSTVALSTGIKGPAIANTVTGKTTTITLVSDGTSLNVSAVAVQA
jgi:hypothetical protein